MRTPTPFAKISAAFLLYVTKKIKVSDYILYIEFDIEKLLTNKAVVTVKSSLKNHPEVKPTSLLSPHIDRLGSLVLLHI